MQYMTVPAQFKRLAADEATLTGHASVFGNLDQQNDIVEPGAFVEIAVNEEGRIPLLWQHNALQPIGVARVREDRKGLQFSASLVLEDPLARSARAHVKAGSVRGVSIGFDVLRGGEKFVNGVRHLIALKLYEISLVTFAANPLARVATVKSRDELEQAACEQLGLSKSQARRLAAAGWPAISREESPEDLLEHAVAIFDSITRKE